ncbi:hypothetical protein QTH16_15205 [Clostridium perfringens]|nr:hypothetical protein [Clostridium perfringens]MDK0637121.1 hypothetical protein [Clostridium perfringens]MDM0455978.1 hypothetical protein [Clostridium perfringens]
MKKKTILSMILIAILTSTLIACSGKKNNYNVTITEEPVEVEEIEDVETLEENKEESNLIFVEEIRDRLAIIYNGEEVTSVAATGGPMDWVSLSKHGTMQKYSYLVAQEKTGDIRTYKYQKNKPDFDEEFLKSLDDEDERETYLELTVGVGVASKTIFKYMGDGTIELINDKADAKLENRSTQELGVNYMITVNGVNTYKITRYDTGTYDLDPNNNGGNDKRIQYGWEIEILSKNNIIKPIDAITVAIIINNNLYVH